MTPTRSTGTETAKGKPQSHRDRLLRQGMRSFYDLGYHGTTVDAILEASDVPKGSFYHHFGSKESFAQTVLEQYMEFQLELIGGWAAREDLTTQEQVLGYLDELISRFERSGFARACLAGKFSSELAASSAAFRTKLDDDFARWKASLVAMLTKGQLRGDLRSDRTAEDLATTILALLQGGLVLALSERNSRSLDSVRLTLTQVMASPD